VVASDDLGQEIMKEIIKRKLADRAGIDREQLDLLICRTGFVSRRTDVTEIRRLIGDLAPRVCAERELIRIGPDTDGGYLLPEDLEGIAACFSPGVDLVSEFELACAQRGMAVFMADKSVDRPAATHPNFRFQKKFIGAYDSADLLSLDHWVSESGLDESSDLLLQMDIEGAEYESLLAASSDLVRRFRIIVAEFHYLDQLWDTGFFSLAAPTFRKLLQTHTCVHAHPNNCCGSTTIQGLEIPRMIELTFYRNDRIESSSPAKTFPHPLDYDNTTNTAQGLPEWWYGGPGHGGPGSGHGGPGSGHGGPGSDS
jgi:hypothetical protein